MHYLAHNIIIKKVENVFLDVLSHCANRTACIFGDFNKDPKIRGKNRQFKLLENNN